MMDRLIRFAVSRRLLVLSLVAVIVGAGVYSFQQHVCSHLQPALAGWRTTYAFCVKVWVMTRFQGRAKRRGMRGANY
jgi:hypothetical protein